MSFPLLLIAQTTRPAAGQPNKAAGVPHFGGKRSFKPDAFEPVFQTFDSFKQYGEVNTKKTYPQLSHRVRRRLDRLQDRITPKDMMALKEHGLFGKLEEASDVLFELFTLQTLRHDILPREELDAWNEMFRALRQQGVPFHSTFKLLRNRLSPEQVREFQSISHLDEDQARNFLGLIGVKFMLLKNEDFDTIPDVRRRMSSEAQELTEDLPFYSPERWLVRTVSWLFSRIPDALGAWSRNLPEWYVRKTLKVPVNYQDMMDYVFFKQMGRQELHYDKPNLTPKARKCIVKPFETVAEAAYIINAINRGSCTDKHSHRTDGRT